MLALLSIVVFPKKIQMIGKVEIALCEGIQRVEHRLVISGLYAKAKVRVELRPSDFEGVLCHSNLRLGELVLRVKLPRACEQKEQGRIVKILPPMGIYALLRVA